MPVIIVSNLVPNDGAADTALEILSRWIPVIQQQPGCQRYAIHKGRGAARGRLLLLEQWADDDALRRYGESADLRALHAELQSHVLSLEDYLVYAPVPAGDRAKGVLS
jgi:quinol monooxygenase YgiN